MGPWEWDGKVGGRWLQLQGHIRPVSQKKPRTVHKPMSHVEVVVIASTASIK